MLSSQIPTKFNIPFANSAGAGFITQIPQASQIGVSGGRASLTDGFPPLTFVPVGAGGIPPWGADFNGLFNQVTAWCRWVGSGSSVKFDAAFSTAIGGYPQGALLQATTAGNAWVSLVDNNAQDPDATPGASQWAGVGFIRPIQNNSYISADDTGVADVYVSAPVPAPATYVKYQRFQILIAHANATTTPTLNITGVGGALGARVIVRPGGGPLTQGDLAVGMVAVLIFDGANFQLQNPAASGGGGGGSSGFGGFGFNVQTFFAPGTYTWIVPTGKTFAYVRGWGAGGGLYNALCGNGGGWFEGPVTVSPGQRITVIIGAGGQGSPPGPLSFNPNIVGGSTSFGNFATATGGSTGPGGASVTGQMWGGAGSYQQGNWGQYFSNPIDGSLSGPGWQPFGRGRVGQFSISGDSGIGDPGAVIIWY